jgi:hypothetical protein
LEQEKLLKEIKDRTGFSIKTLQNHLRMLSKSNQREIKDSEENFSEDIKLKVEELSKNPNLLSKINEILEYEMTGDESNRLFYVAICESRKYKTQMIRPQGQPSSGKNYELQFLKKLIKNTYEFASSTTSHFTRKIKDGEIKTKGSIIIHTEDREGGGKFSFDIDQLYSEEKVTMGFCIKEGNDWKPINVEIEGPITFITTSTVSPDEHGKSRTWITNPDESLEQNERISLWKKWKKKLNLVEIGRHEEDMKVLSCFIMSSLKKYNEIIIPYWDFILFQHKTTDDRRKEDNFELLIRLITHLHQYQRPRDEGNSILVSMPQDFFMAWEISKKIMGLAREGLTERQKVMLRLLRENHIGERSENNQKLTTYHDGSTFGGGDYFTINDCLSHKEWWKWEYQVTYNNIIEMKNKGYLIGKRHGGEWLIKIQDKEDDVLSPFIKTSDALLDVNMLKKILSDRFSDNLEICSSLSSQLDILWDSKYPNPFSKKIEYIYVDKVVKRQDTDGEAFLPFTKDEEVLLKDNKMLENISNENEEDPYKDAKEVV